MTDKLVAKKTIILNKMSELAKPIKQKDLRKYFDSPSDLFVDLLREMVRSKYILVEKGHFLRGGEMRLTSKGHAAVVGKANIDHENADLIRMLHTQVFDRCGLGT